MEVKGIVAASQPKWIPVTERLPDNDDNVLVIVSGVHGNILFDNAYELGAITEEGWFLEAWPNWDNPTVTYWMPLPEPPKAGE